MSRRDRNRGRRRAPVAVVLTLAAAAPLAAGFAYVLLRSSLQPAAAGEFAHLVDSQGRVFAKERASRAYKLVVFGYTHCPDVCPASLLKLHEVLGAMGGDAVAVTPLFVTVDPVNDTRTVLAGYTAAFDPRIIALTGPANELQAFEHAYAPVAPQADATPVHPAMIYLLDRDNRLMTSYSLNDATEVIARSVSQRTRARATVAAGEERPS